jgi:tetratricopeptide (TPR) repeat protein
MMIYKATCLLSLLAAVIFSGCSEDKRYSSIYTTDVQVEDVTAPASATEMDLVEDLSAKRQEYVNAIKTLESYYSQTGNYKKGNWAKRELELLGQSPQYTYVAAGQAADADLRAVDSIPEADELYARADDFYGTARLLALIGDKPKLRRALSMFNQLISDYPTSDKIDDAAYKAATIYQSFGDERLAATYFQRAFQWDPQTPYPARFKAALLMDKKLGMKARALELYRESLEKENLYESNRETANMRIKELTSSKEISRTRKEIK